MENKSIKTEFVLHLRIKKKQFTRKVGANHFNSQSLLQ